MDYRPGERIETQVLASGIKKILDFSPFVLVPICDGGSYIIFSNAIGARFYCRHSACANIQKLVKVTQENVTKQSLQFGVRCCVTICGYVTGDA